jgi:hypothetical protein
VRAKDIEALVTLHTFASASPSAVTHLFAANEIDSFASRLNLKSGGICTHLVEELAIGTLPPFHHLSLNQAPVTRPEHNSHLDIEHEQLRWRDVSVWRCNPRAPSSWP